MNDRKYPKWLTDSIPNPTRFDRAIAKRLDAFEQAAESSFTSTDALEKMKREMLTFIRRERSGRSAGKEA